MTNNEIVWLILILPFVAFLINGFITFYLPTTRIQNFPAILMLLQ